MGETWSPASVPVLRVRMFEMKMHKSLFFLWVSIILTGLFLQGCASVELGGVFHKVEAVPDGQALVYIYRPHMPYEVWVVFDIEVDDVPLFGIADGSYYPWITDPGLVNILCERWGESTAHLPLSVEAGKTYYVKMYPVAGSMRYRPVLTLMPESEGATEISVCREILSN